jgi:putative inorganic carbon (hco3(-)) transporter
MATGRDMPHFGLTAYAAPLIYVCFLGALVLSVLWRPIIGLYFLVPLIPLQTARYYVNGLPLGKGLTYVVPVAVVLGLVVHGQKVFPKNSWNVLLCLYAVFTFASLCQGSFFLGTSLPLSLSEPRLADWVDYMTMPLLLFLIAATVRHTRQMKILVFLMCLATLALNRGFWATMGGRDFSSFSNDLREAGSMGYAGANGFAAFEAQIAVFLLALALFRGKLFERLGYAALAVYSAVCVMYSFSRGAYLALLAGCFFLGIVKQRKLLLVLLVFLCAWTTVVPRSVVERVNMTYDSNDKELDHSAEVRVVLWQRAMHVFDQDPIFGTGFDTYYYGRHFNNYTDTHNYFVKVLLETGLLGLMIFLWLLVKAIRSGYKLFRRARDPFLSSLGLGLAVWVVTAIVANFFGDRWSYLQVNGYMWILAGMVARGWLMEEEAAAARADKIEVTRADHNGPETFRPQPEGAL